MVFVELLDISLGLCGWNSHPALSARASWMSYSMAQVALERNTHP
jgi:hypothetical protein